MTSRIANCARALVKSTPIPAAGVALGVASLGNLHANAFPLAQTACAATAALLVALVLAKVALHRRSFQDDMDNPVIAGTFATLFMCIMQLASFAAPTLGAIAFVPWAAAIASHAALIVWFTARFVRKFQLRNVFTSWFVAYVGIIVGALTSPAFGMEGLGRILFFFGFACYVALFGVVTIRHVRHKLPEAAAPTFCIYTAPMSLSLAGYLAVAEQPDTAFVATLAVLAQALFAVVLTRLPRLIRAPFYQSHAAMTFPFVITAAALAKALACLDAAGWQLPAWLGTLSAVEAAFATVIVFLVFARYACHIAREARSVVVAEHDASIARPSIAAPEIAR